VQTSLYDIHRSPLKCTCDRIQRSQDLHLRYSTRRPCSGPCTQSPQTSTFRILTYSHRALHAKTELSVIYLMCVFHLLLIEYLPLTIIAVRCNLSSCCWAPQTANTCNTYGAEISAYKRSATTHVPSPKQTSSLLSHEPSTPYSTSRSLGCMSFLFFILPSIRCSCCSSLPHCPYPLVALVRTPLHPLPRPAAGLFSITFGHRQSRGSKRPVNHNETLRALSMFHSDKLHTFVFCSLAGFVGSDRVISRLMLLV
jgi:hypothetical protein